jgi:hypothetical protein
VIDLPAALAPWAAQLVALPPELALTLAPWVGRLALAMGPLSSGQTRRTGEPDGYSGLSRRGSYERLVTAEWGVADLFPDEFLRRAAAGEHLFLDLARRAPEGAQRSIALVSAGPAQLGAPRLVHLAALIVLARRATAGGAGFSWGVLEDPAHRLVDRLDEAAIRRLLAARTAVAAGREAIASWLAAIGGDARPGAAPDAAPGAAPDVWFIGGPEDAAPARRAGASCLVVRDLLEPHGRAVEAEIERRGARTRLRLELPAPALCARLLRDPYGAGNGGRTTPVPGAARDVRFAPGGRRLLVQLASGVVESWPIPGSPRAQVGKPRRWTPPSGHSVVALGAGPRSVLAATARPEDPTVIELSHGNGHRFRVTLPEPAAAALSAHLAAATPQPARTCALVWLHGRAAELVIDVAGHLVIIDPVFKRWPPPGTQLTAHVLQVGLAGSGSRAVPTVLATAFYRSSIAWAERHDQGRIRLVEATSSGQKTLALIETGETGGAPAVRFGFAVPAPGQRWAAVAVARDDEYWVVIAPNVAPNTIRSIAPVAGVRLQNDVLGLLTQPDPHRLAWLEHHRRELLPPAATPIVAAAVCPLRPHVAWVTEAGEVVVYSTQHHAVLLRRLPGGVT